MSKTFLSGTVILPGGSPAAVQPSQLPGFDSQIIAGSLAPSPTNYYPMNELSGTTVYDAMGNANGTYYGTFLFQQKQMVLDGKPVPLFNFANSNYATLNDPSTSNTPFTWMIAYSPSSQQGSNSTIISNYNGNTAAFTQIAIYSGVNHFILNNTPYQISASEPNGALHLAFVVYNGTDYRAYIDGALVKTIVSATYTKQGAGVAVGAGANALAGSFYDGFAGKAGIWGSTALSQAQITAITNAFFGSTIVGIAQPNPNVLASAFTPPTAGNSAGLVLTSAPIGLVVGQYISLPQAGTAPYVGQITAISGNTVTVYTPPMQQVNMWWQYPIDAPPSSPSLYDDEFQAPTLASIWTILNSTSGDTSRSTTIDPSGPGWVVFDSPYTTTDRLYGIVQSSAPTVSFTILSKMTLESPMINYGGMCLILEGSSGAYDQLCVFADSSDTGYQGLAVVGLKLNSSLTATGNYGYSALNYFSHELYLKMQYVLSTNTVNFYVSKTGHFTSWPQLTYTGTGSGTNLGTSISGIGVGIHTYGTKTTATCDYFRVTTP
jgi:hypothetical protein